MATTTNYSWTTPDDTDLVKDGAAAIRTLGSAIDTSFAADQGDLLLGGTSDIFEPLAIGAAATILTSDGTTASWVAPASGGKLLQVIYGSSTTSTTISSSTFTDTTLSTSITPSSATSKVLILVNQLGTIKRTNETPTGALQLLRDSTVVLNPSNAKDEQAYLYLSTTNTIELAYGFTISYLDSPSTTSATTYKTQGAVRYTANSGNVVFQPNTSTSTM
jgi:hypothetical protein